MAVTHTAADAIAATTMTNAVADIEQETPEIEKERQLAGVGAGAGTVANGKKKPHDHALASILGPAFVAAVAYVDPGNVAANITSGARYGYLLVWVLVLANCHERAYPVSVRETRHRDQQILAGTAG
jgi:manganese transport protein